MNNVGSIKTCTSNEMTPYDLLSITKDNFLAHDVVKCKNNNWCLGVMATNFLHTCL